MKSITDYHADTSHISKSGLDLINRSPMHYWHRYFSGNYQAPEQTAAFRIGSAFHTFTLEPEEFYSRYAVSNQKFDKRTKEGKTAFEAFSLECSGKEILSLEEFEQVKAMGLAVENCAVSHLLDGGIAEQVLIWKDTYTGNLCKCRPDWISTDTWIVDLKSTDDASPINFGYSAKKYRYDVQAAFYLDGLITNGVKPKGFIFIAVEKQAPYNVGIYQVDAATIELGRDKYIDNLRTLSECRVTDDWSGEYNRLMPLQFPR